MQRINIRFNNWQQSFIHLEGPLPPVLSETQTVVLKDDNPSLVIKLPEQQQILKFIRARHWVEYGKMLLRHSRISKEVNGNKMLAAIGLRVPQIVCAGIGFIPSKSYQFIGYYCMSDLENEGFACAKESLELGHLSSAARANLLNNVLRDVNIMYQNRIVFNDLKFGNIFCNSAGEVSWIDTGISKYPFYQSGKMRKKFKMSVKRFIERHKNLLTSDEKQRVSHLLSALN